MMGIFTRYDKKLAELAPRKAKLQKVIADRTQEEQELAQILAQEAEILAGRAAEEADIGELEREQADLRVLIPRLEAAIKHEKAMLQGLEVLDDLCIGGYFGGVLPGPRVRTALTLAKDLHATSTARLPVVTARLKELEG